MLRKLTIKILPLVFAFSAIAEEESILENDTQKHSRGEIHDDSRPRFGSDGNYNVVGLYTNDEVGTNDS